VPTPRPTKVHSSSALPGRKQDFKQQCRLLLESLEDHGSRRHWSRARHVIFVTVACHLVGNLGTGTGEQIPI
jgi:hypothetical protein